MLSRCCITLKFIFSFSLMIFNFKSHRGTYCLIYLVCIIAFSLWRHSSLRCLYKTWDDVSSHVMYCSIVCDTGFLHGGQNYLCKKRNQCPSLKASKLSTLGFSMGCLILISKKAYNNLKIENLVQGCLLQPKYGLYEKKAYYLKKWPNESQRGPKWAQCPTVPQDLMVALGSTSNFIDNEIVNAKFYLNC